MDKYDISNQHIFNIILLYIFFCIEDSTTVVVLSFFSEVAFIKSRWQSSWNPIGMMERRYSILFSSFLAVKTIEKKGRKNHLTEKKSFCWWHICHISERENRYMAKCDSNPTTSVVFFWDFFVTNMCQWSLKRNIIAMDSWSCLF